ncbi:MAG: DUF5666 domain-containing protein [Burkholderiales bacterium]
MISVFRRAILTALFSVACAVTPAHGAETGNICARASLSNPDAGSGGMGGTGTVAKGGMGGTGITAEATPLAPGSGGMGGTGVVGIITGFASICVNGVEVHYDSRTPVSVNGQAAAARDLAVGQLVVVHARTVGGQLRANGIGAIDAVSGPVTGVNAVARELQVMGQTVRVDNTIAPDLASIKPGTSVRVSGLRTDGGVVVASRLDATPATSASVLGTVSSVAAGTAIVNGTRVNLPQGALPLSIGTEVFVAGIWNGTALQASRTEVQPVHNAISRAQRAIVEGYVTNQRGNQISVGAVTLQLSAQVRINGGNDRDLEVGRKVQVEVRRVGDAWLADRVILQRSENTSGESPRGSSNNSRGNADSGSGRDGGGNSQDNSDRNNSGSDSHSGNSGSGNSGRSDSSNSGSSGSNSSSSGSSRSNSGSSHSGTSGSSRSTGSSSGSGSGTRGTRR